MFTAFAGLRLAGPDAVENIAHEGLMVGQKGKEATARGKSFHLILGSGPCNRIIRLAWEDQSHNMTSQPATIDYNAVLYKIRCAGTSSMPWNPHRPLTVAG